MHPTVQVLVTNYGHKMSIDNLPKQGGVCILMFSVSSILSVRPKRLVFACLQSVFLLPKFLWILSGHAERKR
jgi:hypothetical protein